MTKKHYQDAIALLKQKNIRITKQREAILALLVEARNHPTAEVIYHELKDTFHGISVGTVYNNLRLFKKLGIIQELSYHNEPSHFDFAQLRHFHVICQNCGKVADVFYPDLARIDRMAEQLTGYLTLGDNVEVYGLCPTCQAQQELTKVAGE